MSSILFLGLANALSRSRCAARQLKVALSSTNSNSLQRIAMSEMPPQTAQIVALCLTYYLFAKYVFRFDFKIVLNVDRQPDSAWYSSGLFVVGLSVRCHMSCHIWLPYFAFPS